MKVACVRPGRTAWDVQGRLAGAIEVPLTDEGADDVRKLADPLRELAPKAVYAADVDPAGESARILARALGLRPRYRAELSDPDMGVWQGLLIEDVEHRYPRAWRNWRQDPLRNPPPGADPLQEAVRRIRSFAEMLDRKHARDNVVLVAGPLICRIVESVLARRPLDGRIAPCNGRSEPYVVVDRVLAVLGGVAR